MYHFESSLFISRAFLAPPSLYVIKLDPRGDVTSCLCVQAKKKIRELRRKRGVKEEKYSRKNFPLKRFNRPRNVSGDVAVFSVILIIFDPSLGKRTRYSFIIFCIFSSLFRGCFFFRVNPWKKKRMKCNVHRNLISPVVENRLRNECRIRVEVV